MTRVLSVLAGAMVAASIAVSAQTAGGDRPFRIVKVDPALDTLISPDARLELIGDGFGLLEGPLWIREGSGHLLFSDMTSNVIYKWDPAGGVSVFLENSGYTGTEPNDAGQQTKLGRSTVFLLGSNGLALDPQGRLVICAMADRTVVRLEKDGRRTMVAEKYQGKRFNGPNDVVVASNGDVYFTDSPSGLRDFDSTPKRELPLNAFYLVRDGVVTLLDSDFPGAFPNGIVLSPDGKQLYVSAGRTTYRYDITPDGTVANRTTFLPDAGSDGMKVDVRGNLYTTSGGVRITSPAGTHLGTIQLPVYATEPQQRMCATSVAFGDADGRTLYITACSYLFRIRMNVEGVR